MWFKYLSLFLLIILVSIDFVHEIKKDILLNYKESNVTIKQVEANPKVELKDESSEKIISLSLPEADIKSTNSEEDSVSIEVKEEDADNEITKTQVIDLNISFIAQAPFGEWGDPRQQDGCEESASLMAVRWARGEDLTLAEAKEEILAASRYEEETYGDYRDTSAKDTAERIISGYFGYEDWQIKEVNTTADIIKELAAGNVIITPMNGQKLCNPFYTAPGPERHMLVIRGYDPNTHEFITNDNGTRKGEGYRYREQVLFDAIRDYATGYHIPIAEIKKVMIVIKKIN